MTVEIRPAVVDGLTHTDVRTVGRRRPGAEVTPPRPRTPTFTTLQASTDIDSALVCVVYGFANRAENIGCSRWERCPSIFYVAVQKSPHVWHSPAASISSTLYPKCTLSYSLGIANQ